MLRTALIERIGQSDTDTDALGRLTGHDRRDDLDRGQHIPATAAQLAAASAPRHITVTPATPQTRPAHPGAARAAGQLRR